MAKFNSYLLGKVKKSVGNVTMCYTNKQNIAKAKIFSRRDNPTPEMLDQRAKMKVSGSVVSEIDSGDSERFRGYGKWYDFECFRESESGSRGSGRETRGNHRV